MQRHQPGLRRFENAACSACLFQCSLRCSDATMNWSCWQSGSGLMRALQRKVWVRGMHCKPSCSDFVPEMSAMQASCNARLPVPTTEGRLRRCWPPLESAAVRRGVPLPSVATQGDERGCATAAGNELPLPTLVTQRPNAHLDYGHHAVHWCMFQEIGSTLTWS